MTIAPPITPAADRHSQKGTKPASAEAFEHLSVDVPFDDEGLTVSATPARGPPPVLIEFGSLEWGEEVEHYDPRSAPRVHAQSARKTIEAGRAKLNWKRRKANGPGRTKLPGCYKP